MSLSEEGVRRERRGYSISQIVAVERGKRL